MATNTVPDIHTRLRANVKGLYHHEAAVELLIRTGHAYAGAPWIRSSDDPYVGTYVDWDTLDQAMGVLSGGQQRILRFAHQLATDVVDLAGTDRPWVDLALSALAHAAGTHEGTPVTWIDNRDGTVSPQYGNPYTSLHPWPSDV